MEVNNIADTVQKGVCRFMDTGREKWKRKAAQWLAEWLNLMTWAADKNPIAAESLREVLSLIKLLSGRERDEAQRREILRKFNPLRVQWMLVDGGKPYGLSGEQLQEFSHILYDSDRRGPPVIDWIPSSSGLAEGFFLLARVTQAGTLSKVAACGRCGKWFVAFSGMQKYCSGECQELFWSEWVRTPSGQKYQRDRTRLYREKNRRKP
jgi:hypothetical protein